MNERGVTLIELMVAMILLAIALTGLAMSYPLAMQAVVGGGFQTAAVLMAQECIELAKNMPYDQLPTALSPNCPATPPGYPAFTRTVTVTTDTPLVTTTTVTISVAYNGPSGPTTTTVATILSP